MVAFVFVKDGIKEERAVRVSILEGLTGFAEGAPSGGCLVHRYRELPLGARCEQLRSSGCKDLRLRFG